MLTDPQNLFQTIMSRFRSRETLMAAVGARNAAHLWQIHHRGHITPSRWEAVRLASIEDHPPGVSKVEFFDAEVEFQAALAAKRNGGPAAVSGSEGIHSADATPAAAAAGEAG